MDDDGDDVESWLESRSGENVAGILVVVVAVVVVGWFVAVLAGWA